jgi:hypothetical protein
MAWLAGFDRANPDRRFSLILDSRVAPCLLAALTVAVYQPASACSFNGMAMPGEARKGIQR